MSILFAELYEGEDLYEKEEVKPEIEKPFFDVDEIDGEDIDDELDDLETF
jgi:hypothetical protein